MLKFVIIDSNEEWQKRIKENIMQVAFKLKHLKIESYKYLNSDLKNTIKNDSYHKVYILDVNLTGSISGIKIAELIRKQDHYSHIIFLTNHEGMFEEVHRSIYEIYAFIEKFHDGEQRLKKAIKNIVDVSFEKDIFKYSNRDIDIQIFYKEILYIERDTAGRKLIIHTKKDSYSINMSLERILDLLDSRFKQVHRACIVNNDEVKLYDWKNKRFVLKSGLEVPLLSKHFRIVN